MDNNPDPIGVLVETPANQHQLTERLFAGEILRFTQLPAVRSLITFTRELCERNESGVHPTRIHTAFSRNALIAPVGALREDFQRHPRAATLWNDVHDALVVSPKLNVSFIPGTGDRDWHDAHRRWR